MNRYPAPNSILVCDNAKIHKGQRVTQLCDNAGVMLIFLPPYCPELNPIDLCFAAIKSRIRKLQALSLTLKPEWELRQTAAQVMTRQLCTSLYRHCGYNMPPSIPFNIPTEASSVTSVDSSASPANISSANA